MDNRLVGKTIRAIYMSQDDMAICFELMDGEKLYYRAYGDCCAHAYFYQWQNLEDIVGYPVTEVLEESVDSINEDGGVTDIMFYTIKTELGHAPFEFRISHNGYYGGNAEPGTEADMKAPRELARFWEGKRKSRWEVLDEN